MKQDAFNTSNIVEEQSIPLEGTPIETESHVSRSKEATYHALSIETLVTQCSREIDNYRSGKPWTDEYGVELLRRAIVQEDEEAWTGVQQCFHGLVSGWLRTHLKSDVAYHLESEENYVAQTFERFCEATALIRNVEFTSLATVLLYLHAILDGVILDTLRTYARPVDVMLPETFEAGEPQAEDTTDNSEVWETLQTVLSDEREKRLAYLLFHCGLKSREIMRFYPQEWSDVREIYRIRRNIVERLLHNADKLRWLLG